MQKWCLSAVQVCCSNGIVIHDVSAVKIPIIST